MKVLDPREIATIRAALAMWARQPPQSPILLDIATGGDLFPPMDDVEIAELQEKLRVPEISAQPIDDDIIDFVKEIAFSESCGHNEECGFQDEALDILDQMG